MDSGPWPAYIEDAADFDGDADVDLLADNSVPVDSSIVWFRNNDGKGSFGSGIPIAMSFLRAGPFRSEAGRRRQ
jgi:hypothetical protein